MTAPQLDLAPGAATQNAATSNDNVQSSQVGELHHAEIVGARLCVDSDEQSETDGASEYARGDGGSTSSTSLNSTVTDFRTLYNRRYHAFDENQYWLPNDDEEISRLELQHLIWRLCLNGRLHIAPIADDVHRVIDLGTGTGKWAIEFADLHRKADVTGTDLSPIQPLSLPPNCQFIVDNIEHEWVYAQPFDYIHSRMLCLGIHSWTRYFEQCWKNLAPGGWMEVQETKFPIMSADGPDPDAPLIKWSEYIAQAARKDGIDPDPTGSFRGILERIGFVDIKEQPLQWPIGPWPKGDREKIVGRIMIDNVKQFYRPSAMALYTKRLGWTKEQVEEFLPSVDDDLNDRSKHYYVQMHIVAARKPKPAPSRTD